MKVIVGPLFLFSSFLY